MSVYNGVSNNIAITGAPGPHRLRCKLVFRYWLSFKQTKLETIEHAYGNNMHAIDTTHRACADLKARSRALDMARRARTYDNKMDALATAREAPTKSDNVGRVVYGCGALVETAVSRVDMRLNTKTTFTSSSKVNSVECATDTYCCFIVRYTYSIESLCTLTHTSYIVITPYTNICVIHKFRAEE